MRIGLGYLLQETNTFSPLPSRLEHFGVKTGSGCVERWGGTRTEMGAFLDAIGGSKQEAVPMFAGWGMTEGPIEAREFERMLAMIRAQVKAAGKLDAVLLALHGAMCAQGTDDCEGAILKEIRALVGERTPIVLTLDLHTNLTRRMVELASAVVGYHTYPHIDMYETGEKAAGLLLRMLAGEVRPVMAMVKLPLILPAENMTTTAGPMAEVLQAGADEGMLAYSAFGVQPWLDIEEMGCATLAVADGDLAAAERCATKMAEKLWSLRDEFEVKLMSPRAAIQEALATEGRPVVLAEPSDSPTAGSPGDSADMLAALLQYAPGVPAAVWVCDAGVVAEAWELRPGTAITTQLGGTLDRVNRRPLPITGVVRSLSDGEFVMTGTYNTGMRVEMGRTAVIDVGEVSVVVSEKPVAGIAVEVYRSQGVEPRDKKIVVAKSAAGFRSEYEPFAAKIRIVDTPGISSPNLRKLPYRRVKRPIHPLDAVEWTAR